MDDMFDVYIGPFHKSYTGSQTGTSRSNSAESLNSVSNDAVPSHHSLKKALKSRDGVCLFCWDWTDLEACHIIAQKNIPMAIDEDCIFRDAGLDQRHQAQNDIYLYVKCHSRFDKLKFYVDVVDDQLVLKVVNESDDPKSEKHAKWKKTIESLQSAR